jgi:hypothetical protein
MNNGLQNLACVSLFGAIAVVTLRTGSTLAVSPIAMLQDWRFDPNTLQLEVTLNAGTTPQYFVLNQPPRIVLDLPDTQLGNVSTEQNYSGAVQKIRVSQFQEGVTRIVLDLAPGVVLDQTQIQLQATSRQNPVRWVLNPLIASSTTSVPTLDLPSSPTTLPPAILNPQQPSLVTVPPLNDTKASPPLSTTLPPATFTTPGSAAVSVPALGSPELTVPTVPSSQPSLVDIPVIEFGQPLPKAIQ